MDELSHLISPKPVSERLTNLSEPPILTKQEKSMSNNVVDEGFGFLDVEDLLEYTQAYHGREARDVMAEAVTLAIEGQPITVEMIKSETRQLRDVIILCLNDLVEYNILLALADNTYTFNMTELKAVFSKEAHNE
jgi:hypothetical protein